jgi:hypothetical protein
VVHECPREREVAAVVSLPPTGQEEGLVFGPENLIGPRNLPDYQYLYRYVACIAPDALNLSDLLPVSQEFSDEDIRKAMMGDLRRHSIIGHWLPFDRDMHSRGERLLGQYAAVDDTQWVHIATDWQCGVIEGYDMLADADALADDFLSDAVLLEHGDCDEACEGEYDLLLDEDYGGEFETNPPPIRLALGEEAPPIAPSQVQPYWVGGKTEETCLAPIICAESIPLSVRYLNALDRWRGCPSRTAFELRPTALARAGLCEGDLVYVRLRDDHVFNARAQAGGATRLSEVYSLVCKEGEMRIVDGKTIRIADGRRYEIGRLQISAARPGFSRLLATTGWSGFSFRRIALMPSEDLCLERATLPALPSELARVRFQYAVATPYMAMELQGLYRDILSEHVASDRPQAFNAVKIGREISEYNRSLAQMGGRTLPITLA